MCVPRNGPLALRETHFHGVKVTEQALGKGAVEAFNSGLVAVNLRAPAPDEGFMIFHVVRHGAHEFAPGVNLQQLGPLQRRALVNLLKGLGDLIGIFRGQGLGVFVAPGDVDNG